MQQVTLDTTTCKFCNTSLSNKLIAWGGGSVCYNCYERNNLFTSRTSDYKKNDKPGS